MTRASILTEKIRAGEYDSVFSALYWPDDETIARQRERYLVTIENFEKFYDRERDISIYSVPGRVELCGNHTDHNNGVVMAAAINLDIIAVVSKTDSAVIRLRSQGFDKEDALDLSRLDPVESEINRSASIIRGVAAGFRDRGGCFGGFDAYTTSDVLKGSGLSSSAAFEVCVGTILNGSYNEGRFDAVTLGIIGQFAENKFFGKPSGLMDQTTCSVGGAITIDLKDLSAPVVKKVHLDLPAHNLYLVVTDTKGDHSCLTDDYAAIRREMEMVAGFYEKKCLREVDYETFVAQIAEIRKRTGDRAVLRSIHFFEECRRVQGAIDALEKDDMRRFLDIIIESGHSSFEFNQNAYAIRTPDKQSVSVGLAVSQAILNGRGAWRLQGGGFAGTIQAFVPESLLDKYCSAMRLVFGPDACHVLSVREQGGVKL
ncbi:galactokinase [Synergistales bacterium]|nr:galactokinase [Synergistales bacterium]